MLEEEMIVTAPFISNEMDVHYIVATGSAKALNDIFRILNRREEMKFFHHIVPICDKDYMYDGYHKHKGKAKCNTYECFLNNSIEVEFRGENIRVDKDWWELKKQYLI